MVIISTML